MTIVNFLTGNIKENPLPTGLSNDVQANEFADYFIDKIQTIRDSLKVHEKYVPKGREIKVKLETFRQLNSKELCEIVMNLKSKSCELDNIPTTFLKRNIDEFLVVLGIVVNSSLETGVFDDRWKTAIVRPLIKQMNKGLVRSNDRPVSNPSFLSKIVESAGMKQILDHYNHNDLFPPYQSAYRANYSCETALLKIVNDILWHMENKKVTILVAMDLSVAFDTVDHDVLLNVLEKEFGTPIKLVQVLLSK